MLSWSLRRRLIYLAIILFLGAIAVVAAFIFLQKPPSCFDGKQNGTEVGVDCGGSCARVCPVEISPLRVLWSRLFDLGNGKYNAVALVKNPNPKHGANFSYTFRLWDQDGLLINTYTSPGSINPREDLVILESRLEVGKKVPARLGFELGDSPIWQKFDQTPPKLTFSNKRFENYPTPRLLATLKNESLVAVRDITVSTILSDANQNAVAVSSTFVESLPGGASQDVAFSWPLPLLQEVSFIDLASHFDWQQLPTPAP